MKIRYAAALSGLTLLIAVIYSVTHMSSGLSVAGEQTSRLAWLTENSSLWTVGVWLWLLAVFGWMVLLVTLSWNYLPGFRVASMLQSGLMIIAAVLAIIGLVTWMGLLPTISTQGGFDDSIALVDAFVMGMFGSALFMGGAVTAWIGIDLAQIKTLSYIWVGPAIIAGLLAVPSPFLLPVPWLLFAAATLWIAWCIFLFSRQSMPNAFAEML